MPSLAHHHSASIVKLLLLGDSKSGKTTSLASLVLAGYKLRILDFDNLLDNLARVVRTADPALLDNIEYRPLRDKLKGTDAGMVIEGKPRAWIDSLKMLNVWRYTDADTGEVIDLGPPASWGPDCILVIDSLSRWCDAAYDFHALMTPGGPKGPDGRAIYGNAQDDVEKQLAGLTSAGFTTNVIIIAHGTFIELEDGTRKIFPQGVGQKLSPKIPQYFPNYIQLTRKADKRVFRTVGSAMIDLATTVPVPAELPADTGLAEFFAAIRQPPAKSGDEAAIPPSRPKSVTLVRRT
jgi:hypothetical protein